MRVLAEIAEMGFVIYMVLEHYKKMGGWIHSLLPRLSINALNPVSFLLAVFLIWGSVIVADSFLKKLIHTQLFAPVRVIGGALAGGFYLLLIASLFAQAAVKIPLRSFTRVFEPGNSYAGSAIVRLAAGVHDFIDIPIEGWTKKRSV